MRFLSGTKLLLTLLIPITLTSCSWFSNPYVKSGTVGGVVGAGVGAGTGALVGSAISSGDVAASTLLGGGIGLPVGILAGVLVQSYTEKSEIEKNSETIQANYQYIMSRQREIDEERERLIEDSLTITPDKHLRAEIYTGPTIGTYNR
ncbi:MAG: hypothetical protein ACOX2O_00610 [Bdellovibrionota bacterium]